MTFRERPPVLISVRLPNLPSAARFRSCGAGSTPGSASTVLNRLLLIVCVCGAWCSQLGVQSATCVPASRAGGEGACACSFPISNTCASLQVLWAPPGATPVAIAAYTRARPEVDRLLKVQTLANHIAAAAPTHRRSPCLSAYITRFCDALGFQWDRSLTAIVTLQPDEAVRLPPEAEGEKAVPATITAARAVLAKEAARRVTVAGADAD